MARLPTIEDYLLVCVDCGRFEYVKTIFSTRDIDELRFAAKRALHSAIRDCRSKFAIYFLDNGVETDRYDLHTAILHAAGTDNMAYMTAILETGFDIDHADGSAMYAAADRGNFDMVRFLVRRGADVHISRNYAFRCATWRQDIDAAKFLIAHGARFTDFDHGAIRTANRNGSRVVVEYLLSLYDAQGIRPPNRYAML